MAAAHNQGLPLPRASVSGNMPLKSGVFTDAIVLSWLSEVNYLSYKIQTLFEPKHVKVQSYLTFCVDFHYLRAEGQVPNSNFRVLSFWNLELRV